MNGWRGLGLGMGGFIASVFPRATQASAVFGGFPHRLTLRFKELPHYVARGVLRFAFCGDVRFRLFVFVCHGALKLAVTASEPSRECVNYQS